MAKYIIMAKSRAQISGDITHELHRISEAASAIRDTSPEQAQELNDAVSCMRRLVSDLLVHEPSTTASIEAGFSRSLTETTLDQAQGL